MPIATTAQRKNMLKLLIEDVPKAEKEVLNKALNKAFTSDAFNVFCNKTSTCTNARTVEDSRQFVEKYFKGLEKYSKN